MPGVCSFYEVILKVAPAPVSGTFEFVGIIGKFVILEPLWTSLSANNGQIRSMDRRVSHSTTSAFILES